ncbi:hypothetical protein D3C84_760820 [compost metagenome]
MGTAFGFGDGALHMLQRGFTRLLPQIVITDGLVPSLQRTLLRALEHRLLIRGDHFAADVFFHGFAVAQVTGGHHETRHQTFDIPLPGAGMGLIEVIDAEQQVAFRRGETAEVHQVTVTTDRRHQTHVRRAGQVVSLQQRVAAIKGEWRHQHATVAQLDQRIDPSLAGSLDQWQRVTTGFSGGRLSTARAVFSSVLALLQAVFEGGHGDSALWACAD